MGRKSVHDVGIEVSTDLRHDRGAGSVVGERVLVSAPRCQSIVHVSQRPDPPAQGNRTTSQSLRITGAVKPLVMGGCDVARHFQKFHARELSQCRIEGLRSQHRMRFHDLEFVVAQTPRLEQDAIGNADLADIMQGAGQIDQANVFGVDLAAEFIQAAEVGCQDA